MLELVRGISDMVDIHYIRQKEPRGLGHAINCAKSFVGNEPFAVMLGDDVVDSEVPCLKQLINCFNEYKTTILGVQTVEFDNVNKYGIIDGLPIENRVSCSLEKVTREQRLEWRGKRRTCRVSGAGGEDHTYSTGQRF